MTLFLGVISPESYSDSVGQVGVEAGMRSFYPPRKKGHSYRHFVKPSAARHSVTVSGRPATMGLNSIRHGRICSHLKGFSGFRRWILFSVSPALSVSSASVERLGQREIV